MKKRYLLVTALIAVFGLDLLMRQFGNANTAQVTNPIASTAVQVPAVSSPIAQESPSGLQPSASQSGPQPQKTQPQNTSSGQGSQGMYKNGVYAGSVADAYYGYVQVQVTVQGGNIADVQFLQYPNTHSTSVMINSQAMPYLKSEAIQAQSANVNIVSGATQTSLAFQQSLADALTQAKA